MSWTKMVHRCDLPKERQVLRDEIETGSEWTDDVCGSVWRLTVLDQPIKSSPEAIEQTQVRWSRLTSEQAPATPIP